MTRRELADEEIEAAHEAGQQAGDEDTIFSATPCPYADERADVWWYAYRNAYARSRGR